MKKMGKMKTGDDRTLGSSINYRTLHVELGFGGKKIWWIVTEQTRDNNKRTGSCIAPREVICLLSTITCFEISKPNHMLSQET